MNGGVLGFLKSSPERTFSKGKRCFPERSVGVSKQSPAEFQLRNTLVNPEGYVWAQPPQIPLFSHTTYVSVVGNRHTKNSFKQEHDKRSAEIRGFNRKKGLLSQFMDNHAWKRGVDKLMGFERSPQGRRLRNVDLDRNKSTTDEERKQPKTSRRIKSATKNSKDDSLCQTVTNKFEQKNNIRRQRNNLHENQLSLVSSKRKLKLRKDKSFVNNEEQSSKTARLYYKEMNTTRSQSQNYQTIDNWFASTARSDMPNAMKFRKSIDASRTKPSRSAIQDGFYKEEIEEFENKFLKSGLFKKARSNYWNKLIENSEHAQ